LRDFATPVIPGLVPGIQPSTNASASREMDPGDERRDDVELGAAAVLQRR